MEVSIYNSGFVKLAVIDHMTSLIWTDRFCGSGDFELRLPVDTIHAESLVPENLIKINESEKTMIISSVETDTNANGDPILIIRGDSLEFLLDRRIIWPPVLLEGSFQDNLNALLTMNAIDPEDPNRAIPNMVFAESEDAAILSLTVDAAFLEGENLYSSIKTLCEPNRVGFKMVEINKYLVFFLYKGTDRSYQQSSNPYVVFSPSFDNLLSSNYTESMRQHKTVTTVSTGKDAERITFEVGLESGALSGWNRREMYTDANSVPTVIDGEPIDAETYMRLLTNEGLISLYDNSWTQSFDADVDPTGNYIYGRDFILGDIVQVSDGLSHTGSLQITGITFSQDSSGYKMYPTFEKVN